MKIAIDARIINSGTGRYIERLLHYLEDLDTRNQYLILVRRADLAFYKPKNPNFKIIEAEYANYSFGEQLGFARLLYRLKPDLVHFCLPQQPLLYMRPAVTSILDLNLLRITTNDDMGPWELRIKKAIFSVLLYIVARRSRHIITISQHSKQDIMRFAHVKDTKITVTYPAADKAKATPVAMPNLQGKQFIMYVGRAEPYKNNRGLVLAHQELLKNHPDLLLVIAGRKDALRKADEQWVREHGYKNIIITGQITDEQLAWLYLNCRAYVFPSFMEGFGLPGLEAMVYNAPVASSNASCLPEIYQDAALYFDPASPDDMAHTIERLITDDTLRAKLAAKGAQQVKKYSWRRMAEQTLAEYQNALKR